MNSQIKLIDSHQHFWDLTLKKNSWLIDDREISFIGDYSSICRSYLPPEYLNETKKFYIDKSIHVQAGWDHADPLGEVLWLNQLFKNYNVPNGIVAYANLTSFSVEKTLEMLSSLENVKGVRQILSWHSEPYLSGCSENFLENTLWRNNFYLLKKYNLSFDAQIYPEQTDSLLALLTKNRDIPVVINHALMPRERNDSYLDFWYESLKKISKFDNVFIKISGFPMFDHELNVDITQQMIRKIIDLFSPQRCMIGSNFPVDKIYYSFDHIFSLYISVFNEYSKEEQTDLLIRTAKKFYKLNN